MDGYEFWNPDEASDPRVSRLSLRDLLATLGIASLFIGAALVMLAPWVMVAVI